MRFEIPLSGRRPCGRVSASGSAGSLPIGGDEARNGSQAMIDIAALKPGRLVTILLQGEHDMTKGGRKGVPLNPLLGRVTRDHRIVATIAGPETYARGMERDGLEVAGKAPWWVRTTQDGVVAHRNDATRLYVACVPTSAQRTIRYLVDGRPATDEEVKIIRDYTPESEPPRFLTFAVENIANLPQ